MCIGVYVCFAAFTSGLISLSTVPSRFFDWAKVILLSQGTWRVLLGHMWQFNKEYSDTFHALTSTVTNTLTQKVRCNYYSLLILFISVVLCFPFTYSCPLVKAAGVIFSYSAGLLFCPKNISCCDLYTIRFLFPLNLCETAAQFGAGLFIASYHHCHHHHHPAAWKSHREILGGESLSSSVNAKHCSDKFADEVGHWSRTAPFPFVNAHSCFLCILHGRHILE